MNIWKRIILEYQAAQGGGSWGPGMWDRPEATRNGIYNTFAGTQGNFGSRKRSDLWPYSVDGNDDDDIGYGIPQGPRGLDRGTPMGVDFSGHPVSDEEDPDYLHKRGGAPEPKYQYTWDDGPGEQNAIQKYQMDEGWKQWGAGAALVGNGDVVKEAMGQPTVTGPFVPYDGPSMRNGRNSSPPLDVDGNPVAPESDQPDPFDVDRKGGPGNMWGGSDIIPGEQRGFTNSPAMGDNDPETMKWKPPEEKSMNLKEFFDASAPPAEEVENPEQTHEKDQTDDEIENKIDKIYGQENNHEFDVDGTPEEKAGETRVTPGMLSPNNDLAGIVMLDDEPAGTISVDGGLDGDAEDNEQNVGMNGTRPTKAGIDAQDFQLTVEPEAGQMLKLSQFMDPQDHLNPMKGGPNDVLGMQKQAHSLLPQKSQWDEIVLQVGDAIVNLRKTGGKPSSEPQTGPLGTPPMMERRKTNKRR